MSTKGSKKSSTRSTGVSRQRANEVLEIEDKLNYILGPKGPMTKADKARALFRLGADLKDAVELLNMAYSQALMLWKEYERLSVEVNGTKPLQLSPTQVRYLTQDGHAIVKVDKENGAFCQGCGAQLIFSLKWLGFVHAHSSVDPTKIEDYYPQ